MKRFTDPIFLAFLALMLFISIRSGRFSDPMDWFINTLYLIPAVVIAISFHEFAHGWVAYKLGDPTPKFQNRLTINPASHIDPIGFVALLLAGFGWGVPVQINPNNFNKRRRDELLVSVAGVAMNLLIAIITAVVMKIILTLAGPSFVTGQFGEIIWTMLEYIILINLALMIFNLIPVPPLDGFSVVTEIFNIRHTPFYYFVYNNGFFILMAIILFGVTDRILGPGIAFFSNLLNAIINL